MSKYSPLKIFLENSRKNTEVLTIHDLEEILGFSLPKSAINRSVWWGNENNKNSRHTHCKEWLGAGWKVENIVLGKTVTFSRIMLLRK